MVANQSINIYSFFKKSIGNIIIFVFSVIAAVKTEFLNRILRRDLKNKIFGSTLIHSGFCKI